jgi:hypothetical protein
MLNEHRQSSAISVYIDMMQKLEVLVKSDDGAEVHLCGHFTAEGHEDEDEMFLGQQEDGESEEESSSFDEKPEAPVKNDPEWDKEVAKMKAKIATMSEDEYDDFDGEEIDSEDISDEKLKVMRFESDGEESKESGSSDEDVKAEAAAVTAAVAGLKAEAVAVESDDEEESEESEEEKPKVTAAVVEDSDSDSEEEEVKFKKVTPIVEDSDSEEEDSDEDDQKVKSDSDDV